MIPIKIRAYIHLIRADGSAIWVVGVNIILLPSSIFGIARGQQPMRDEMTTAITTPTTMRSKKPPIDRNLMKPSQKLFFFFGSGVLVCVIFSSLTVVAVHFFKSGAPLS